MTMKGKIPHNKGKRFPHTPAWEAKRLAAVREAAKHQVPRRGWKHSAEAKAKMSEKAKAYAATDAARTRAVQNLPRTGSGDQNPNWRGGRTSIARSRTASKAYRDWQQVVLQRDRTCRDCGTEVRLQAHHLIAISRAPDFALLPMNGVALCKPCHRKTESYGAHAKNHGEAISRGTLLASLYTIPHRYQVVNDVGNWAWLPSGGLAIFVSALDDWRHEALVALHEMVEAWACRYAGITQEQVDAFDAVWHRQPHPRGAEAGNDPTCPYHWPHIAAGIVERFVAFVLRVEYEAYDEALNQLIDRRSMKR